MTFHNSTTSATSADHRGVEHTYSYDKVGGMTADTVTALPWGVDGSVRRMEYVYYGRRMRGQRG